MANCICGKVFWTDRTFCSWSCAEYAYNTLYERFNRYKDDEDKNEQFIAKLVRERDELRYDLAHTTSKAYKRRVK